MQADLKIDLANLAENYHRLKRKGVASNAKVDCSAVVKADAYGLGAAIVAKRLYDEGCKTFFVAFLLEALEIRSVVPDPDVRVFVLGGVFDGEQSIFVDQNISPVLNNSDQAGLWLQVGNGKAPALHLDTGMSRLGFQPEDYGQLPGLVDAFETNGQRPLLMTHLCSAEEPVNPSNPEQLKRFVAATAALTKCERSFANSSGTFLGAQYHFDLLRPGVALYGANPEPGKANPMLPVVGLDLPLLQVRQIPKGASVGYNSTWTAHRPSVIGTLQSGYADGLFRTLSGKARLYHQGVDVPLIGRVSMDAVTVDLTDLPNTPKAGDRLELLGPNQTVDDLAASGGTIGYEILTSLGARYQRTYVG